MVNDLETLLIACALATVVVTGVFATTVAMRHNDEANRAWTASFAAALCVAGLEAIYGTGDTPIIVAAVINASSVFALGAMWAGCRLLDGRTHSYIWIPFGVSILVMLPVLALSTPDRDLETAVRCGVSGVVRASTGTITRIDTANGIQMYEWVRPSSRRQPAHIAPSAKTEEALMTAATMIGVSPVP
jgi:hypothetical protein